MAGSCKGQPAERLFSDTTAKVYVCKSATSYAYHKSKDCRWLNHCTHTIVEVTEGVAMKGRRRCKVGMLVENVLNDVMIHIDGPALNGVMISPLAS